MTATPVIITRVQLSDASEVLLRQVAPVIWHQEGRVTSQVFRPTKKDLNQLSTNQGNLVSPEEAYNRYTAQGFDSAGVWGITVGECLQQDLPSYPDPLPQDDSHACIDFTNLSTNKARKAGAVLADCAHKRGQLHP